MARAAAAIVVVLSVALGAGCGGGSSGGDPAGGDGFEVVADTTMTTAKSLGTKAEFVRQVNGICRENWPTILGNFAKYSGWQKPGTSAEVVFAKTARETYMASVDFHIFDEIHFMGAPPGQARAVEKVIGELQEAVERGQRQVRVTSRPEIVDLFSDYNRAARQYGFTECLVEGDHLPHARKPEGLPSKGGSS